jgi:hypothetical protein
MLLLLLILGIISCLTGCAECISTEYKTVEVKIVNKYHRARWLQPHRVGKVTTFITHPAVWRITVEYEGVEYFIHGSNTYYKYKDKIGETTVGTLEIKTYNDGTVKYDIISLGEK